MTTNTHISAQARQTSAQLRKELPRWNVQTAGLMKDAADLLEQAARALEFAEQEKPDLTLVYMAGVHAGRKAAELGEGKTLPSDVATSIKGPYNACMFREHCISLLPSVSPQAPALDAQGERTPQDYAIEHAEYMAQYGDRLIAAVNDLALAEQQRDDGEANPSDVDAARETATEAISALRNGIYEFRKRRDRVTAVPPPPAVGKPPLSRDQTDAIWDAYEQAPTLEFRYLVTGAIERAHGIGASK